MTLSAIENNGKIILTDSLPKFFREHLVGENKFDCAWTKLKGEFRVGTFDLRVRKRYKTAEGTWKKNKGKRKLSEWVYDTYCLAFDLDKKDYVQITYNTIEYLKIGEAKFSVKVKVNKEESLRLFEMKSLNKIKSN